MNVLPVTPAPTLEGERPAAPVDGFTALLAVALDGAALPEGHPGAGDGDRPDAAVTLADIVASTADAPRSATAAAALAAIAAWRAEPAPATTLGASLRATVAGGAEVAAPPAAPRPAVGEPVSTEAVPVTDSDTTPAGGDDTAAVPVPGGETSDTDEVVAVGRHAGAPSAGDPSGHAVPTEAPDAPPAEEPASTGSRPDDAARDQVVPDHTDPAPTPEEHGADQPRPLRRDHVVRDATSPSRSPAVDGAEGAIDAASGGGPATGPAEVGSTTVRTGSAAVDRVLQALDLLENAPPPRRLTVDVDGVRLSVSLAADGVSVDVRATGTLPPGWKNDLEGALAQRGFDLSTGGRDARDGDPPDHPPQTPEPPHGSRPRPTPAPAPAPESGVRL